MVLSVSMLGGGGLIDQLMPGMGEALHGLGNRVISEADASGVIRREYIWLGDRIVAAIDGADTAGPNLYYVVNDYLDRPIRMRDANHVDVWKAAYRPFGEAIVTGSASLDARLPGQWFQLETGLSWNWHCTYDPSIGRYIQPDPLGLTDGPSLFGYAHQSPLMGIDPEGLICTKNFKFACRVLKIDPLPASEALHVAKGPASLGGADNCMFDTESGDISFGGEVIRNLHD